MPRQRNLPYVQHYCPHCDKSYMDIDRNNAQSYAPVRYCFDCVTFEGMSNEKDPAKVAKGRELARMAAEKRKAKQNIDFDALEGL